MRGKKRNKQKQNYTCGKKKNQKIGKAEWEKSVKIARRTRIILHKGGSRFEHSLVCTGVRRGGTKRAFIPPGNWD